jgi:hypothetical protein
MKSKKQMFFKFLNYKSPKAINYELFCRYPCSPYDEILWS